MEVGARILPFLEDAREGQNFPIWWCNQRRRVDWGSKKERGSGAGVTVVEVCWLKCHNKHCIDFGRTTSTAILRSNIISLSYNKDPYWELDWDWYLVLPCNPKIADSDDTANLWIARGAKIWWLKGGASEGQEQACLAAPICPWQSRGYRCVSPEVCFWIPVAGKTIEGALFNAFMPCLFNFPGASGCH